MTASLYLTQFLTIAIIHLLAVAAPGPDFAMVVRQSVRYGWRTALLTSLGIACGLLIHVTYALLGIGVFIAHSLVAFTVMKVLAAACLIILGIKALQTPPYREDGDGGIEAVRVPGAGKAFVTGVMTNAFNPKAALFILSLFTVVITPGTPGLLQAGYGVYMGVATALWFTLVSSLFSHAAVRSRFLRMGHWFDRTMGTLLIVLGLGVLAAGQE
ncbi:threonine/homoserine/homoserine lactone efflux protein [Methanofollis sp. W23]|uniref:LysE family translocator n=1 Tax=Methanofollis sp. W23 TaxID=2817849 RepID=UPI001AEB7012|nr:LysE family transporter [Methanofollis sp. W23]MBP2145059.1 threonine/homoserine/homoserine lactone efflux protein [Methanofollis sp. W23]